MLFHTSILQTVYHNSNFKMIIAKGDTVDSPKRMVGFPHIYKIRCINPRFFQTNCSNSSESTLGYGTWQRGEYA